MARVTVRPFNSLYFWTMEFPERLARLRKERNLTQQALADQVGVHVLQIRRYEGGNSQPTLDVIRRLAQALRVSADQLVFDHAERGPDEELRFQFEAISRMPEEHKEAVRMLLDAMIVKSQVEGALERVNASAARATKSKKSARGRARA